MFERYNEHTRRVLFFARYQAAQIGSRYIEPEDLLLGVLRESTAGVLRFARGGETAEAIVARVESSIRLSQPVKTSVEIPFSDPCKAVLSQGAIEADLLENHTIRIEHLVLGILVKSNGAAARALQEAGIDPNAIREYLRQVPDDPPNYASAQMRSVLTARASAGVARQWKGVVKPGLADQYIRHLQRETLPSLERLEGFIVATIVRREIDDGTEFQVTTLWRSLDAIKAFAGDDITLAVVPPAAQALLVRYDERAVHYDIVRHA